MAVWPSERTMALIFEFGFGSSIGAAEVQLIRRRSDSAVDFTRSRSEKLNEFAFFVPHDGTFNEPRVVAR